MITIKKSSIFHLSPKYAFFPNTPRATIFKIISSVKKENTICSRVSKTLHWSVKHSLSKGLYKASMIQLMTITKITIRSNHLNEILRRVFTSGQVEIFCAEFRFPIFLVNEKPGVTVYKFSTEQLPESYSGLCRTSKMECFTNIFHGF